ncbi:MAG: AAA family ATPase [Chloroflexota bacterium]|nr:AAA family ATPase [Chloroflexota bacterium]
MSVRIKTVVIFIGLPYTGKTTLIQRLQEVCPGDAIFADAIFTRSVPPSQISLNRWFQEGSCLVRRIKTIIKQSANECFFVELGTMLAEPRAELVRWCNEHGYKVIPIWCRCDDDEALQQRHRTRIEEIGEGGRSGAKIDITLDDLYERICAAFEQPASEEGYFVIDTYRSVDETLATIHQLLISAH